MKTAEDRAVILWITCLLVGFAGAVQDNLTAMMFAFAAIVCATILVKSY